MRKGSLAHAVGILCAATARVASAQATTPVSIPYSDSFNYGAGSLSGRGQWFTENGGAGNTVSAASANNLAYLQNNIHVLPRSAGGSVLLSGAGPTGNRLPFAPSSVNVTGSALYYSFTLRIDNLNGVPANNTGAFFASFTTDRTSTDIGTQAA